MVHLPSPSPVPSHSSRLAKSPLQSRVPSSEYLPVPRHASGSQQSSPLLEPTPLSDKTLNDDDLGHGWSSPQAPMQKQKRKYLFSRISPLNWICYTLHSLLIIIHALLLGMLLTGVDHHIIIPPIKANFYSMMLTVIQQTFFTVYQGALVVITQQLALRSNLLRRQTLTALHDKSVAWGGLGASILSLWRQGSVPTAVYGTFCVVLYLLSISILHVSSSSLIDVETYDTNVSSLVKTSLGLPNMTVVGEAYDEQSWDNAGAVASSIGQLPATFNYGVVNNIVYDTLTDTTGVGNATVNAPIFTVKCYSAEEVNSTSSQTDTFIAWGDFDYSFAPHTFLRGCPFVYRASTTRRGEGPFAYFPIPPPIPDSNGALGTTFPVTGTIYGYQTKSKPPHVRCPTLLRRRS
ncbi:hypothetical protein BS17DRAFT_321024 [Gyrodon lividus]|nr:hypothetical protein BS17DRAFT_321024 [Gyrodon lividus]